MPLLALLLTLESAYLCWSDVTRRRLPNWATVGGLVVALAAQAGLRGWTGLWDGFLAALVAGAFLIVPYFIRAAGAGDVKMMAACGAFLGLRWTPLFLVLVSVAGLLVALAMLVARRASAARLRHWAHCLFDFRYDRAAGRAALPSPEDERGRIPFGVAVALGAWATLAVAFCA